MAVACLLCCVVAAAVSGSRRSQQQVALSHRRRHHNGGRRPPTRTPALYELHLLTFVTSSPPLLFSVSSHMSSHNRVQQICASGGQHRYFEIYDTDGWGQCSHIFKCGYFQVQIKSFQLDCVQFRLEKHLKQHLHHHGTQKILHRIQNNGIYLGAGVGVGG